MKISNIYFKNIFFISLVGIIIYSLLFHKFYYSHYDFIYYEYEWKNFQNNYNSYITYFKNFVIKNKNYLSRPLSPIIYTFSTYYLSFSPKFFYFITIIITIIISCIVSYVLSIILQNNLIGFLIGLFYLLNPTKLLITIHLMNFHILNSGLFFVFSILFFLKSIENNSKILLLISLIFYAISINFAEVGVFYFVIYIILVQKLKQKINDKKFILFFLIIILLFIFAIFWKLFLYEKIIGINYYKKIDFHFSYLFKHTIELIIQFFNFHFFKFFWFDYIIRGIIYLKNFAIYKIILIIISSIIIYIGLNSNITNENIERVNLKLIIYFLILGLFGIIIFIPSTYGIYDYHSHINVLISIFTSSCNVLIILFILKIINRKFKLPNYFIKLILTFFIVILIPIVLFRIELNNRKKIKMFYLSQIIVTF